MTGAKDVISGKRVKVFVGSVVCQECRRTFNYLGGNTYFSEPDIDMYEWKWTFLQWFTVEKFKREHDCPS